MRSETAAAIADARLACERAVELASVLADDRVPPDWRTQSALERQLEILGEALVRVRSQEEPIFDLLPDASRIISLRNLIAHGYDAIDPRRIVDAVSSHGSGMLSKLDSLLDQASREGH